MPGHTGFDLVPLAGGGALAVGGFVAGGQDGELRETVRVSRFDPSLGAWVGAAPLDAPRIDPQIATLADGRVLLAGGATGRDDLSAATLTSTGIYDPATDRWTPAADLTAPRKDGVALVLDDGSVLLLGGDDDFNVNGDVPWCPEPLATVERFVPGS
jgi:hypothetical protein